MPRIPSLKKPFVKNPLQWIQKPGNVQRLISRLFPLGAGGLRTGAEVPRVPVDVNDLLVPYDYSTQYPGFQTPIFGEAQGEPEPYLEPGDRPQEGTAPRSGQKPKEKEKTGEPPLAPTLPLEDVPRPDDLVEDVPPVHPVEQSDEAEDEGEPKQPKKPRRRPPEYDVYNCKTVELLTGIPCDKYIGSQISITSKKNLRTYGKKSKAYRKGRTEYFPF